MCAIPLTSIRRCRMLLAVAALTVGLAAPATPAQATNCTTTSIGGTNSQGRAGVAKTTACAPAYGQPTTSDTGRKVG
jgi:hypothetical protein